jgi:hypothetical protein
MLYTKQQKMQWEESITSCVLMLLAKLEYKCLKKLGIYIFNLP